MGYRCLPRGLCATHSLKGETQQSQTAAKINGSGIVSHLSLLGIMAPEPSRLGEVE